MRTYHRKLVTAVLLIAFCVVFGLSLSAGQYDLGFMQVVGWCFHQLGLSFLQDMDISAQQEAVLMFIRAPRTVVGLMVGAGLAASGTVLQGLFSNPLADPGIIGVSSGATMGAVLAICIGINSTSMIGLPIFAFTGAIIAVSLTIGLATRNGRIPVLTLLLAGVVVGMLFSAVTAAVLTIMDDHKVQQYLFWTIGSLDYRRWEHVLMGIVPISLGIMIMLFMARHLNILALGEAEAKAVGMPVAKYRLILLIVAALTTASSVCISGSIGFVGLIIPHMMRMLVGPNHKHLLPASILAGAVFLVLCDSIGRILLTNREINVGIMTAVLGTPYFLYLLRKNTGIK
ncbi:MAG: iron ABC transporter permease [Anaerovibrio sp.]|uniref:FecCD family ABC transporter permease n=1 Tax=Anaerovibrio sp. TaxID=1872532 RepID=UPI0025FFDFA6|nr:iron ABC transporter permease [Anaerovibrio sp.]MCR5177091.1 iron ABC transporter permease [Anaerovibrio sp.]